jgi:RalA-binding protein 1
VSSGSINESPPSQSQAMAPNGSRPSFSSTQPSDSSIHSVAEARGHQEPPPSVSTSVIPPTPTRRSQTDPTTATSRSSPQLPTSTNVPQRETNPRPRMESSPVRPAEGPQHQTHAPSNPSLMPSLSSANTLTPEAAGAGDPHKLSRDSRITLPDETSRYLNYSHLIESPMGSPSPGSTTMASNAQRDGSVPSSPLRGVPDAPREDESPVPGPSKTAAPSVSSSGEFLDLDTTDDGEYAGDSSQEAPVTQHSQPYPAPANTAQQQQPPAYGNTGGAVTSGSRVPPPRPPRRARSSDVVESSHASSQGSAVELVPFPEERVSSDATARSVSGAGSTASLTAFAASLQAHSNNAPQAIPTPSQQEQQQQRQQQQYSWPANPQQQQGSPPAPANASSSDLPRFEYKSAKLTNDDLPHTVIRVDGSTIRSNDRGKEVLSFLISVSVKGKEPWKVEKLYSDVLALDGRIRVGAGKNQGKKIASLPDNKLFKDNAPAKVDQRKIALEVYLQSLVLANLRTRDDVCMFFSTGIIRPEREPVHQLGHKEGYLTKRSKNFGGYASYSGIQQIRSLT